MFSPKLGAYQTFEKSFGKTLRADSVVRGEKLMVSTSFPAILAHWVVRMNSDGLAVFFQSMPQAWFAVMFEQLEAIRKLVTEQVCLLLYVLNCRRLTEWAT